MRLLTALSELQQKKIHQHLDLLESWNKAFNLTAITQREDMLSKHVEDSLAVIPYVTGESILDVGSGAGFPGIPLAIALPEKQFVLLDSNGKKTRFLFQVKTALNLSNVHVVQERVENFKPEQSFDHIICRAFSQLDLFHRLCQHLAHEQTIFMAMKGKLDAEEVERLEPAVGGLEVQVLSDPALGERHLLRWLKR